MFKNIIISIKAFFIWVLKEKNRGISIKFIKLALSVAQKITPLTKTDIDDKGLEYVMKKFNILTQEVSEEKIQKLVEIIDKDTKQLQGLNLSTTVSKEKGTKIEASYGLGKVEYNPMNGEIKLGINL